MLHYNDGLPKQERGWCFHPHRTNRWPFSQDCAHCDLFLAGKLHHDCALEAHTSTWYTSKTKSTCLKATCRERSSIPKVCRSQDAAPHTLRLRRPFCKSILRDFPGCAP